MSLSSWALISNEGRAMQNLLAAWSRLISDSRAVTALEYGMIAALIAAVVVTGVTQLGAQTNVLWVRAGSVL